MDPLPVRGESLQNIYRALLEHVDDIGVAAAASEVGVSPDTIRRRVRGTQPWGFEEVLDLARDELARGRMTGIAKAIAGALSPAGRIEGSPLKLPSNLREMLRLVGRLTTEIADTLDDQRVDRQEARRLLELLSELDQITAGLRIDLGTLIKGPRN